MKEDCCRISFLFGAGTEGKNNFGLPNGVDFFKQVFIDDHDDILTALKDYFKYDYYDGTYKYSKNRLCVHLTIVRMFVKQKVLSDDDYLKKHRDFISTILSYDDIAEINKLKNENLKKEIIDDDLSNYVNEFKHYWTEKYGKHLTHPNSSEWLLDLFDKNDINLLLSGVLDSYFHTIINPAKFGPINFSKIFNYYWICYFTIIDNIVKLNPNYFSSYLNEKGFLNYFDILNNLEEFTRLLYNFNPYIYQKKPLNNYYQLIKREFQMNNNLKCVGILTTNYYNFAEILSDNISYLNGNLKLFEIPEDLDVIDLTSEAQSFKNKKLLFPFIFGQSYVKPIIHKNQILTFGKGFKILEDSEILVILGFNLNEDDNHVNSMIKNFVKNDGVVIKVKAESEENNSHRRIRCDESKIYYCTVERYNDNEIVVKKIFETINKIQEEMKCQK